MKFLPMLPHFFHRILLCFFRSILICLLKLLYFIYIVMLISETYSEPCETSKVELFAKIVNGLESLTIFVKNSILGIWQGSEYGSRSIVPVTGKLLPSTPFLSLNINQAITLTRRQLSLGVLGEQDNPPWTIAPKTRGQLSMGQLSGGGRESVPDGIVPSLFSSGAFVRLLFWILLLIL